MKLLTETEIAAMKERCEKATPGPWEADLREPFTLGGDCREVVAVDSEGMATRNICSFMLDTDDHPNGASFLEDVANAELLAHARTDIPALLLEREELLRQLETERLLVKGLEGNLKACEEHNEELLKDKERLDWLEKQIDIPVKSVSAYVNASLTSVSARECFCNRETIDAAIAKGEK